MNIRHARTRLLRALFCMLLLGLGATPPAISTANSPPISLPEGFTEEPPIEGFDQPIAFDWTPDGRLFVGEKGGSVRVVKHGTLLQTPAVAVAVDPQGDAGLLGLVVDPIFPERPYLYLYYTTGPGSLGYRGKPFNRVSRFTVTDDDDTLATELILVDNIVGSSLHNGGDLHFGPDGLLYISTGDGGDPSLPQNLDSINGKILRVDPLTGLGVPQNPFYGEQASPQRKRVWALGLRNPHRFAIHPLTGEMRLADVGDATYEELNQGRAGANYGWPLVEGPQPSGREGMTYPLFWYTHRSNPDPSFTGCPTIAAGLFFQAGQFPADYAGAYFFADTFCERIWYTKPGLPPTEFAGNIGNAVHLAFGPDGMLYYSDIYGNRVRRISYRNGNRAPMVAARASITVGPLPLEVQFSSAGTNDPDGDALTFSWDFGDGHTATTADAGHTYLEAGNFEVVLTVQDTYGASARSLPITIFAGNSAPQPVIATPEDGARIGLEQKRAFRPHGHARRRPVPDTSGVYIGRRLEFSDSCGGPTPPVCPVPIPRMVERYAVEPQFYNT